MIPLRAPRTPAIQVSGAPSTRPPDHSSGYSPRFHTLPSSSWAWKASSPSSSCPALMSRSQMTTARTPSMTLVRSVTVVTTRWGRRPCPRFAAPSNTYCMPGRSGVHRLSIVVGWVKLRGSKSPSVATAGRSGTAPVAVRAAVCPRVAAPPRGAPPPAGPTRGARPAAVPRTRRSRMVSPLGTSPLIDTMKPYCRKTDVYSSLRVTSPSAGFKPRGPGVVHRRRRGRQRERERAPAPGRAVDPQTAAVRLCDLAADRESQAAAAARAAPRAVGAEEAVEHAAERLGRDAGTRVRDRDADLGTAAPRDDGDRAPARCVGDRVVDEVDEQLVDALGVGLDDARLAGRESGAFLERHALGRRRRRQ